MGEKPSDDVSNSLNFDESIQQQPEAQDDMEFPKEIEAQQETPRQATQKPSRITRKITKVKDLLRESQENALQMNKADLDKMFNL